MKYIYLAIIPIALLSSCEVGGLPTCESDNAKTTLTSAFDESQFARQLSLSAIEVSELATSSSSSDKKRLCTAKITMNNTSIVSVKFNMEARDDGNFNLLFEVVE